MSSRGGSRAVAHLAGYLEASAARARDRIALVGPDGRAVTYGELDDRASRVSGFLLARGVAPGDRVAVVLPKGVDAVTAIFGILKAGAAYVPADFTAPPERNASILKDCGVRLAFLDPRPFAALRGHAPDALPEAVVIVGGVLAGGDAGAGHLAWASAVAHAPGARDAGARRATDLAYILCTSGSTGKPKGIPLTHENATAFVDWVSLAFDPTEDDRFSSHAPFHFDLSILDLYVPLKHGASLHLIAEAVGQSPKLLARFIAERRLTVWYSVPSILAMMAELGGLEGLGHAPRLVLFAGEVFPVNQLRRTVAAWPRPAYYNLYGPTETNVVTFARIPALIPEGRTEPYPIGPACAHCEALVLGEDGEVVARGGEGLLHIAGPSVFSAYWNRPEESAARFVERAGKRFYNTGDVVREDPDEGFVYVGRRDRMVKRRGFRIELGEIESGLYGHERLREVAVVALPDADGVRIHACVVARDAARPSIFELKQFCGENLPSYMSPDVFVFMDALPRTSTDKVDYQALLRRIQPAA